MEWIELGKLGKVSTGNTPSKKKIEYYNENYIELVKPSNFTENIIVSIESGEEYLSKEGKSKGRVGEVGDILVTCIGNIGNVGIASKEVCFNQQINGIKVDKKKALSKYVAYSILYIKPALNHVANKAVVPIINKSTFEKTKIPVPPMDIQKQIVEVLDEAQKLIDNRKNQIKLLDDLIESIFYDMFGDPVKNDKGWEVKKLGELTSKIGSGATPRGGESSYKKEGISLIRSMNVYDGKFVDEGLAFIDEEQASKLDNVKVLEGDVLINITGASINRTCIVPKYILPARVNQHVSILRPKGKLNNHYLLYLLISRKFKRKLNGIATSGGATREAITKGDLEKLEIPIPPLSLQNQFAEKVKAIEKQKELLEESLKLMEDNYNSLMQRAFKGELF